MTLRTQNLFVLLPVFLGMAVIIGFSRYTAELQELRWGLDQEAASFVRDAGGLRSPPGF